MNPTLLMYVLQSRHGQLLGFQDRILDLKIGSETLHFISAGTLCPYFWSHKRYSLGSIADSPNVIDRELAILP